MKLGICSCKASGEKWRENCREKILGTFELRFLRQEDSPEISGHFPCRLPCAVSGENFTAALLQALQRRSLINGRQNQKNPRAHKNKIGTPPPQSPKYPPLKRGILWTWLFLQNRRFFPGVHKIGAAISGPRIADKNFTDTRIFLTKGRFRKRVVLADVPSFVFSFRGNMRHMYPRSGFRSGGTSERTLVPVFVPGENPPRPPFFTVSGSSPTPWSGPFRDHGHGLNPPLSTENPRNQGFSGSRAPLFGFGLADPAPKG